MNEDYTNSAAAGHSVMSQGALTSDPIACGRSDSRKLQGQMQAMLPLAHEEGAAAGSGLIATQGVPDATLPRIRLRKTAVEIPAEAKIMHITIIW